MNGEIKLSIIIPHYNTSQLLSKLLYAIPQKKEIEVIVIDDNSDRTAELEECVAIHEKRGITFLKNTHSNNGGGAARNVGIENASGEWIMFCDADDMLAADFYNIIISKLRSDVDLVYFDMAYINAEEASKSKLPMTDNINAYMNANDKEERGKAEFILRYYTATPCAKVVRLKLLQENNILFDEIQAGNDLFFSCQVGFCAQNMLVVPEIIYYVNFRLDSTSRKLTCAKFEDRVGAHVRRNNYLNERLSTSELMNRPSSVIYLLRQCLTAGFGIKKAKWMITSLAISGDRISSVRLLKGIIRIYLEIIWHKIRKVKYYS